MDSNTFRFGRASKAALSALMTNGVLCGGKYLSEGENLIRKAKRNGLVLYDKNTKSYIPCRVDLSRGGSEERSLTVDAEMGYTGGTQTTNPEMKNLVESRVSENVNHIPPPPPSPLLGVDNQLVTFS